MQSFIYRIFNGGQRNHLNTGLFPLKADQVGDPFQIILIYVFLIKNARMESINLPKAWSLREVT
jgi:hypothetical protein